MGAEVRGDLREPIERGLEILDYLRGDDLWRRQVRGVLEALLTEPDVRPGDALEGVRRGRLQNAAKPTQQHER